jgi:hypothetical protein
MVHTMFVLALLVGVLGEYRWASLRAAALLHEAELNRVRLESELAAGRLQMAIRRMTRSALGVMSNLLMWPETQDTSAHLERPARSDECGQEQDESKSEWINAEQARRATSFKSLMAGEHCLNASPTATSVRG